MAKNSCERAYSIKCQNGARTLFDFKDFRLIDGTFLISGDKASNYSEEDKKENEAYNDKRYVYGEIESYFLLDFINENYYELELKEAYELVALYLNTLKEKKTTITNPKNGKKITIDGSETLFDRIMSLIDNIEVEDDEVADAMFKNLLKDSDNPDNTVFELGEEDKKILEDIKNQFEENELITGREKEFVKGSMVIF